MVDGFLSILTVMIFLILLWGEWFNELAQEIRLKKMVITLYLFLFLLLSQWSLPVGGETLGLGFFFFPIPFLYFVKAGKLSISFLLGNSLILATLTRTLDEILYNDPVLMVVKEPWMSAFLMGVTITLLSPKAIEALATLFLGFLLLEVSTLILPSPQEDVLSLFSVYEMDRFFLTLFFLPFFSLFMRKLFTAIFGTGERDKMKKDVRM